MHKTVPFKNGNRFDDKQLQAITHVDGCMLTVAGPGSGKTTVITERIKYLITSAGVNPADILVITFTRAAAGEMETRFKNLTKPHAYPVRFGTFHSIFFWIIKTAYKLDNSCIMTEEEKRKLVYEALSQMSVKFENKEDIVTSALAQMSIVKCDMIDIQHYYSHDMPEEVFRTLYRNVTYMQKKMHKLDFDDMMVVCYELLTKRPDVLAQCRRIFRYIMVDEFQDSNRLQYEILKLLAKPACNLFVVGDDDQSVYGFRGARPGIMQQFCKDFPSVKQVTLDMNYRCVKEIVAASQAVILNNGGRFQKNLRAFKKESGIFRIVPCKDVETEYRMLVEQIRSHAAQGIPYENQAILFRTNMQSRRLVYKLNSYGLPYVLNEKMPNIFEHFAVKNVLDYMHIASGDLDRARMLRIMNKPSRYISRDVLTENPVQLDRIRARIKEGSFAEEAFEKFVADLKVIRKLKPFAALNFIRRFVGYDDYLKEYAEYRQMDVDACYEILDEFGSMISEMNSFGEVFLFVEEYEEVLAKSISQSREGKGISLLTMHGAKGLEFDCVYIIDAVEGITPYRRSRTDEEMEEERRMFYVAMTRAKEELYIYVPSQIAGKVKTKSRFICEIEKRLP